MILEDEVTFDTTLKKKKKKAVEKEDTVTSSTTDDYSYEFLLKRAFEKIGNHENKNPTIPAPVLLRQGKKRILIKNFKEICNVLQRPCDQVASYFSIETGT